MKIILAIAATLLVASCASGPMGNGGSAFLNDQRFATVQQGMTRDDVQRLLGPPRSTMAFPLSGNDSWEYAGQDTWGYRVEYSVTFDPQGRVTSKLARRLSIRDGDR